MIKRIRPSSRKPVSKISVRLVELARHLSQSSCRTEDKFWERMLFDAIESRLLGGDEHSITVALDQLYSTGGAAYGALIDSVEACCECLLRTEPSATDIVLFAMPILAWSRLPIPTGRLSPDILAALRAQLHGHILAKDAKLALANHLLSPDQLPQSYCDTRQMAEAMVTSALHDRDHPLQSQSLQETATFLSDTRFVLGAIAVPAGKPLFRWQEEAIDVTDAEQAWQRQAKDVLRSFFPACAFELMAPSAFHAAVRNADRAARAYSITASVDFLRTVLGVEAPAFHAIIGSFFSDRQLEEYRIGFSRIGSDEVLHGIVWPVLDDTDESPEALAAIEQQLRAAGIGGVTVLREQLPMEFCDDCGAPLFPNREGEPVHAELPGETDNNLPQHLH